MNKNIYLRFDIDTITCIEKGVPRLLNLANKLDVKFTFFVNMGHAISRLEILLKTPSTTLQNAIGGKKKISAVKKMGLIDTTRTLLFNPKIGNSQTELLERILLEGHELGLHGGNNHSIWQRHIHKYSLSQLYDILNETHVQFTERFGMPKGFASPGANGSATVYSYLSELGYSYVSDHMGNGTEKLTKEDSGLTHIPINIQCSYASIIENLRANGFDSDAIISHISQILKTIEIKTMYGHPVWEGYRDIDLMEKLVVSLKLEGYAFKRYQDLL